MAGNDYDINKHNGYFMGSHFEYEATLKDNPTLAAHFVHSILWLGYHKKQVLFRPGMTKEQFYNDNSQFLQSVVQKYLDERGYSIPLKSMSIAIAWWWEGASKLVL